MDTIRFSIDCLQDELDEMGSPHLQSAACKAKLALLVDKLQSELTLVGIAQADEIIPSYVEAKYCLKVDPFHNSRTLSGVWRDKQDNQKGEVQIRDNGSVFVEVDVIQVHPKKPQWFVEGVTAWGNGDDIKSELKLIPMVQ